MKSAAPIKNKYIMWSASYLYLVSRFVRKQLLMNSYSHKPHVIVYSRPGCPLCDDAKAVIQNAGIDDLFTLEEINIESDPELLRKYKYDIPVIAIDGVECFIHRVDADQFKSRVISVTQS